MEAPAELLAALPALATALALLLAWLLLRRGAAPARPGPGTRVPDRGPGAPAPPEPPEPCAPEPAPAEPRQPERTAEPGKPAAEEPADEGRQDEEQDSDSETGPPTEEPEEEDGAAFSFKYSPGQLRGSQYKKMMTKEELEEEQRVQKEQLAAIFQLMKDNKETFGEMSDCDMQDQLRLYDM
ncbi:LOW QUALITY PROTEIN: matrix-remodeling-associated protein 7 isoform X2 [Cricetulus griseus]|uniref:LOW QUALITY PROTEIN: matrix-remodeling-associated protein 7 isoform X2 n=1 Tax=Cricetulus griseus TaxID=10029 RepID=A0A9J7GB96_CRIGR|nr:LOW QUALITY PROTEIN: matrix-remodeling-associated protein 7 isoform X2 [Cricetulus griseus]